ncbi:hypothetical protein BN946_scf184747.g60 [Trametes cinnabarina]|uniref:Uncharacterized protein n=1 Tax=Pycnoporus cinnabarinus TaxID=5643 RepID=A0A060SRT8_PYCCI|nr:hypothetical protein BN946_scf184747.g60 [Trametes cinnabarina]
MSSHGWVYVDDTDPSIVYSGGDWITSARSGPSSVSGVFDGTLHGAQTEGITATFKFTGSEVGVIGTSGWTDKYGWPAVDFSIDGVQQDTSTFPPGISATTLFTNVTFFDSPVSPEAHILTITNLNGTAPNTFWFDYIFYRPLAGEGGGSATLGGSASTETGAGASSSTSGHLTSTAAMLLSALTDSGRSSVSAGGQWNFWDVWVDGGEFFVEQRGEFAQWKLWYA